VTRLFPGKQCSVALLLLTAWSSAPAAAQTQDSFSATIKHAVTEYESGNWAEAHTLFARAHDLNPNARTWRGLGLASFEMRHYLAAVEELSSALVDTRKPLSPAQRHEVESVLARAQQFLAVYRVRLDPPDAELLVDNQIARLDDGQLRLDAGEYAVTARALGYQEHRSTLRVEAGTRAELPVVLVAHAQLIAEAVQPTDQLPVRVPAPVDASPRRTKTGMLWAGGTTLALGIAAHSWAWYAFSVRVSLGNTLSNAPEDNYEDERQQWVAARAPLLAAAITGAGLTMAGVELMLFAAPNERLPWWLTGLTAATGVGLATWGLIEVVPNACSNPDVRACVPQNQKRERGTMVLLASAPFFCLPITKLARGPRTSADRADLRLTLAAAGLALNARW
jgi:hypothetical protein